MTNWNGLSVEPASIPHLLHWDLAYLWAIEQAPDQLSSSWTLRVNAWKRLLDLFIGGELAVVDGVVPTNLNRLLGGFGLRSIKELRLDGRVVGILSPLTIVRPLPDVSAEECEVIPKPDQKRRHGVIDLLNLLAESLEGAQALGGGDPLISALQRIVQAHRIDRQTTLVAAELAGGISGPTSRVLNKTQTLQLLRSYQAVPNIASSNVVSVDANIFDRFGNRFVPTCDMCSSALLSARNQAAVRCQSDIAVLICPNCNSSNSLALENLFISFPSPVRPKAIIWTDRLRLGDESVKAPPPEASRSGNRVEFEWTASEAMHAERRFLALEIETQQPIEEVSVESLFYSRYLDCGPDVSSIPMKRAWANWLI